MTKTDSKKIIKLAQLVTGGAWHSDWRSSKMLHIHRFFKIAGDRGGYNREREHIRFMLLTKERRQFFDAYIKLIQ